MVDARSYGSNAWTQTILKENTFKRLTQSLLLLQFHLECSVYKTRLGRWPHAPLYTHRGQERAETSHPDTKIMLACRTFQRRDVRGSLRACFDTPSLDTKWQRAIFTKKGDGRMKHRAGIPPHTRQDPKLKIRTKPPVSGSSCLDHEDLVQRRLVHHGCPLLRYESRPGEMSMRHGHGARCGCRYGADGRCW